MPIKIKAIEGGKLSISENVQEIFEIKIIPMEMVLKYLFRKKILEKEFL